MEKGQEHKNNQVKWHNLGHDNDKVTKYIL